MPFAYYDRLSRRDQETYRRSDAVTRLDLPAPERLLPSVEEVRHALAADDRLAVQAAAARLCRRIVESLGAPPVAVMVLAVRPTLQASELHGLYTFGPDRAPRIRVWMRTVRHRRVVAFRTFLRTLLHELLHHLDYTHLRLADSFHTEGFFKRESSLFRQLVPDAAPGAARLRRGPGSG